MNFIQENSDPDAEGFFTTVAAAAVKTERITPVRIAGKPIILTRIDGRLYAVSALCPHAAGDLRYGALRRGQISCPDHGYRFDIRSGRATWPEDEVCRLKQYTIKEEEGMVKVKVQTDGC